MYPVNTELGIIPGYNRSYIKIELLKENYLVEGGPQVMVHSEMADSRPRKY